MPTYKLTSFNIRGRGELIRYLFADTKTDYTDNRVTEEQWSAQKEDAPFDQLPYLEFDGKKLAHSRAIEMYLAQKFGLAGKTPEEQAFVLEIVLLGDDLFKDVKPDFLEKDETLTPKTSELLKTYKEKTYPKFCEMFEKKLPETKGNSAAYFVGKEFTLADLAVYYFLDSPVKHVKDLLNDYPKLKAHRAMVEGRPNIKAYIAKRVEVTPIEYSADEVRKQTIE